MTVHLWFGNDRADKKPESACSFPGVSGTSRSRSFVRPETDTSKLYTRRRFRGNRGNYVVNRNLTSRHADGAAGWLFTVRVNPTVGGASPGRDRLRSPGIPGLPGQNVRRHAARPVEYRHRTRGSEARRGTVNARLRRARGYPFRIRIGRCRHVQRKLVIR